MRDYATVEQLVVLANLESLNSEFIKQKLSPQERVQRLNNYCYRAVELTGET